MRGNVRFNYTTVVIGASAGALNALKTILIGVILTGNNYDGSHGLKEIKRNYGLTIVQTPESAEADAMPRAAIKVAIPQYVLPLEEIGLCLETVSKPQNTLKASSNLADNNQTNNRYEPQSIES